MPEDLPEDPSPNPGPDRRLDRTPDSGEPVTLDAALAEIRALRRRISEIEQRVGPPDPVVLLSAEGVVQGVSSWPWEGEPIVGRPFAEAFDGPSADTLAQLAERGWLGASERRLELSGGRQVSLSVVGEGGGYRVAVRDVTRRAAFELASEQRRRMAALADLAGSLARELTDPMSIVQGRLELLLDLGVSEPEAVRRHLGVALEHARRVSATLRNLWLVGRIAEPTQQPVRLASAVEEALDLVGPRRTRVLPSIRPEDLSIGCDGALTARMLASLVRQGLEAQGRSGVVHLRARQERARVSIRIGPSGRIGEDVPLDREELALERTLIASVGGELVVRRSGAGLQFDLALPCPVQLRVRQRPPRGRIAVIGRDEVVQTIPSMLARDGYTFGTARSIREALELLGRETFDAVLAELLLDDGSSLTLVEWLEQTSRQAPPRVIVLYEGMLPVLPPPLLPLRWPVAHGELLDALERRSVPGRRPG